VRVVSFVLILLAALVGSIGTAIAQVYLENGEWVVTKDAARSACVAEQVEDNAASGLLLERTTSGFTLTVTDRKLVWLQAGQVYDVTAIIDRSNWTGTMAADQIGGRGALKVIGAADVFVEAIQRGSRLFLSVDGTRYGPYSLSGTRLIVNAMTDCVANASTVPAHAATDEFIGTGYMTEWIEADIGKTFRSGDVAVRMQMRGRLDGIKSVAVDVSNGKSEVVSFDIEGTYGPHGTIGLVKLEQWRDVEHLLFTNFTGGAHCCTEVRVVDFSSEPPVLIDVGTFDTGTVEPKDIDGDGYQELAVPDERFRAFDSYAGSFPPLLIYAIAEQKLADVTRDVRFAQQHKWMFDRQAAACGTEARLAPGACAGLLGTAAVLGLLGPTSDSLNFDTQPEASAFPWTYFKCDNAECSKTTQISDFLDAIKGELPRWGYLSDSPPAQFTDFMADIDGKSFGDPREGSEMACDSGPVTVEKALEPLGSTVYRFGGYESGCSVSTGQVVGNTLLTRAVCQGEGMPPWIEEQAISLIDHQLLQSTIDYRDGPVLAYAECSAAD
jgi:hypothetical protein